MHACFQIIFRNIWKSIFFSRTICRHKQPYFNYYFFNLTHSNLFKVGVKGLFSRKVFTVFVVPVFLFQLFLAIMYCCVLLLLLWYSFTFLLCCSFYFQYFCSLHPLLRSSNFTVQLRCIFFINSKCNILVIFVTAATVESLLKQLTHDNRQIMMWDELKTWQTSLGLYKSGAASDYDTTIYLTAYNGGSLKKQTCNSRCSINLGL